MLKRTLTGLVIGSVVYLIIMFSHVPGVLICATAFICAFAVYEIYHVTGLSENKLLLTLSIIAGVCVSVAEIPYYSEILGFVFIISIGIFVYMMIYQKQLRLDDPIIIGVIVALIIFMFKSIPELRSIENGFYYLLFAITLCFVTDVFAYFVGKFVGRHKLIPSVSPNKTVEGSVGGVLFAVIIILVGGVLLELFTELKVNYLLLAVYAVLGSLAAQFGDLSMSVIKRICNVKDFSNLFPGHGGVLDRFDSHIFALTFTLLFYRVTGGFLIV